MLPALDLPALQDALLGDARVSQVFDSLFSLMADPPAGGQEGGQPRPLLYAPRVAMPPGSPDPSTLPLMVYLPGIDGTGERASVRA